MPQGRQEYEPKTRNTTMCDDCGEEYATGDWPYCPHGRCTQTTEFSAVWDEHICEDGALIKYAGQRRAIMKQNGLDYRSRRGMPGQEY
jgi:hypothetical protein